MPEIHLMKLALMLAFLIMFTSGANAFTCAQVRWAVANLTPAQIAEYMRTATKAQIAFGRACLRHRKHR